MTDNQLQAMAPGDILYGPGLPPKRLRFSEPAPDEGYLLFQIVPNEAESVLSGFFPTGLQPLQPSWLVDYFPTALQSLEHQLTKARIDVENIEASIQMITTAMKNESLYTPAHVGLEK